MQANGTGDAGQQARTLRLGGHASAQVTRGRTFPVPLPPRALHSRAVRSHERRQWKKLASPPTEEWPGLGAVTLPPSHSRRWPSDAVHPLCRRKGRQGRAQLEAGAAAGAARQAPTAELRIEEGAVRCRPATAQDLPQIQLMVLREFMNPLSLVWERFVVAELHPADGPPSSSSPLLLAVGQIKRWDAASPPLEPQRTAPGPFLELRSLVVLQQYRGQGIGSFLASQLLAQAEAGAEAELPLFLLTIGKRVSFYERLGFQEVVGQEIPPQLRIELALGQVVAQLAAQDRCLAMALQG